MKYFPIIVILSCYLLNVTACFAEGDDKEDLYSQLNRAIIRLEHIQKTQNKGTSKAIMKNVPDGTAFFVYHSKNLFVVSARHIVEQPYDLQARVECLNTKTKEKEIILLKLKRDDWIFHQNNGDDSNHYVDVAAMKIKWIKDRTIKYFIYAKDDEENKEMNHFPNIDPVPPRAILIFGFPLNIGFELLEQRPFGRSGIISMKTGKRFLKFSINGVNKLAEERCYVIDAEIFPGNSGSPIINQTSFIDSKLQLLGLISASNTQLDFAVAEPVSRIRETIDFAIGQNAEKINCWHQINNN